MNTPNIVTGKIWSDGRYNLKRKGIFFNDKIIILEIKNGCSKLSEKVNHIHYKISTIIIWKERLGLLYKIST